MTSSDEQSFEKFCWQQKLETGEKLPVPKVQHRQKAGGTGAEAKELGHAEVRERYVMKIILLRLPPSSKAGKKGKLCGAKVSVCLPLREFYRSPPMPLFKATNCP